MSTYSFVRNVPPRVEKSPPKKKKFCSGRPVVLNEMRIEKCFKIMFTKWIKEQFLTEQIQHVFDAGIW